MLSPRTRRASLVTASLAAALLALVACDSGSGKDDSKPAGGPSVIVPGGPGEDNKVLSAEEARKLRKEDDTPNSADIAYAQMMIVHHRQALEMTRQAPDHAASGQVKQIAERISAEQGPEIESMRSWLRSVGADERAGGHDDHMSMPGMATEAQLDALRAAHGKEFDALFLKLMTAHHEGAIAMAADVKGKGNNLRVEEMADDVIAQQSSEITRMNRMT